MMPAHELPRPTAIRPSVLCVEDEPNVLEGLALHLRRRFQVNVALGGEAGLKVLADNPTIEIVLSDMRMPGIDGATFLARVRRLRPDVVRMLLTGESDIGSAAAAINDGQIFRFLQKPCPPERLLRAFDDALDQRRMITAERVLLEETLHGCIKALTEILSLANPVAFGRATHIKDHAAALARAGGMKALWVMEVAAMLSQIGAVTLPETTAEKLYAGEPLGDEEQRAVDKLPGLAVQLLSHIPRIDEVRACLIYQRKNFDGSGEPGDGVRGESIPIGARILRIVMDFDQMERRGAMSAAALETMRARHGRYDPVLLEEFVEIEGASLRQLDVRQMPLRLVVCGMKMAEDVRSDAGVLLLPRGFEVTEALVDRIRNCPVRRNVAVIVTSQKPAGGEGSGR